MSTEANVQASLSESRARSRALAIALAALPLLVALALYVSLSAAPPGITEQAISAPAAVEANPELAAARRYIAPDLDGSVAEALEDQR